MCFDKAPRDETAPSGAKDSLAELLYGISTATHDEEEGDAAEDDMGEAMLDDDDDDDNVPPPPNTHTPTHTAPAPLQPHVHVLEGAIMHTQAHSYVPPG